MTRARPVRPTDLVALVSFEGKVFPNQAVTWDSVGRERQGPPPLESALEQWFSFATGRHTWISIQGQTIKGLVSARQRSVRAAWEVNCLVSASDDDEACLGLLDQLSHDAGQAGVEKVFLRLASDSDLVPLARAAGFVPYVSETLFQRCGPGEAAQPTAAIPLRPRNAADLYPLYQLYNAAVPERARRVEAPTFREWRASREVSRGHRRRERVVAQPDGRIAAWLQVAADGDIGRFDLLVHPQQPNLLDGLVGVALFHQRDKRTIVCLVPEYKEALSERLAVHGFAATGRYLLLAKRLLRTIPQVKPAAAAAIHTLWVH